MARLNIIFRGIVLHVGNDEKIKQHAAIINDPEHVPVVTIAGQDLIPPQANGLSEQLRNRDTISFNVPGQGATATSTFTNRVPTLRDLLRGGTLHQNVRNGVHPHPSMIGVLRYPAGNLSAPGTFPHMAEFRFDLATPVVKRQCVADSVLFESSDQSSEDVTMTIARENGQPFTRVVRSGATIEITNESAGGRHFHLYRGLTDAPEFANARETAVSCPDSGPPQTDPPQTEEPDSDSGLMALLRNARRRLFPRPAPRAESEFIADADAAPHPECSNSAWP